MSRQPSISHIALRQIVNGEVIEYGSQCYGTADGSQFLGYLPAAAESELKELLSKKLPTTLAVSLKRIANYIGLEGAL